MNIPFIKTNITGRELHNIANTFSEITMGEGGNFSRLAESLISNIYCNSIRSIVTTSIGTSFDLAADLLKIKKGDEVILPSFTYVSAANAFAKRGAKLRFIDIEENNINVNIEHVIKNINNNTKAIIVPHYSGYITDITSIRSIVENNNIAIIEDLSGSFAADVNNTNLKIRSDMACGSFHEDEYLHCGEAGFLLINNDKFTFDVDLLKYRGTNKIKFLSGHVDHFGWEKIGGEYCANELTCAFLCGQLQEVDQLILKKLKIWENYNDLFNKLDRNNIVKIPELKKSTGNFYIKLPIDIERKEIISSLFRVGVECRGHFYPLHLTDAGKEFGIISETMLITEKLHKQILRLPSFIGITFDEQERVVKLLIRFVENKTKIKD
jgi:dTDP-4-amino-4,6-dideoxygalactose transaminase